MSDRRPEDPKLYAGEPDFDAVAQKAVDIGLGHHVSRVDLNILVAVALESMETDPIAAVRRGVESGTIKGERIVLDGASVGKDVPDDLIELVFYMEREKGVEWFRRGGDFILVPASDGGSET